MAMPDGLLPTGKVKVVGAVTERVAVAVMFPVEVVVVAALFPAEVALAVPCTEAVMVVVPAPMAVTRPLPLTVATAKLDELHEACEFKLTFVFPLDSEPVA